MKSHRILILFAWSIAFLGCNPVRTADHPRLSPMVRMQDVRFRSPALAREMTYRVITPANIAPGQRLPVIWLLHGAGATFRDWSNQSDIAMLAGRGIILVMPDAGNSFYVNSATHPDQQYETYLVDDLIPDVRRRFPAVASDRAHNAAIGISRGGFGAVLLALKHPELFSFVGGLSSALDLAERPFRWKEPLNSLALRSAFGPPASAARSGNDPFILLGKSGAAATAPLFYFTCGEQDILLKPNRRFTAMLAERHIPFELHTMPGNHDWGVWNAQLPGMETAVLAHFAIATQTEAAP